jgi:hypothetical protein
VHLNSVSGFVLMAALAAGAAVAVVVPAASAEEVFRCIGSVDLNQTGIGDFSRRHEHSQFVHRHLRSCERLVD